MTNSEVIAEIRNMVKPYLHAGMPQSSFASTIQRIERERATLKTVRSFFASFGYIGDHGNWQRPAVS